MSRSDQSSKRMLIHIPAPDTLVDKTGSDERIRIDHIPPVNNHRGVLPVSAFPVPGSSERYIRWAVKITTASAPISVSSWLEEIFTSDGVTTYGSWTVTVDPLSMQRVRKNSDGVFRASSELAMNAQLRRAIFAPCIGLLTRAKPDMVSVNMCRGMKSLIVRASTNSESLPGG